MIQTANLAYNLFSLVFLALCLAIYHDSAMEAPPVASIPPLPLHEEAKREEIDVAAIAEHWLLKLQRLVHDGTFEGLSHLFIEDCWWRDIVGITWDFTSRHGGKAIRDLLENQATPAHGISLIKEGGLKPILVQAGPLNWIHAGFSFKTKDGEGRGLVRLANTGKEEWKAWTIFTQLEHLNFQKDRELQRNKKSNESSQNSHIGQSNGQTNGTTKDLQVLIVGAGK